MDVLVPQLLAGLSFGSTLFLVSGGLTLIFGVTRVVNFAHGALYMVGAYLAFTLTAQLPTTTIGFFGGALLAAVGVGLIGIVIEIVVLRRIYSAPEIFQLLATFGVALVIQDATRAIWGNEELFAPRVPGFKGAIEIGGALIPEYNALMTLVGPIVFALLYGMLARTRFGVHVRAATQDREMAAALGINEKRLFTLVFALGAALAGLAGALQIPRETVNLQMDLTILVEAFVVVVVGGLGSVTGAFIASMLIGIVHAVAILWLPQSTLVLIFVVMALTLVFRPYGLLGRPEVVAVVSRALAEPPFRLTTNRSRLWLAIGVVLAFLLPTVVPEYAIVIATEMAILALFAASLQFFMGQGGLVSFGHAAFFGVGAYVAALAAVSLELPFAVALIVAPLTAGLAALVCGVFVLRAHGVYAAMLTLAFAQILWSIAVQWIDVTGGDNGVLGVWPPTGSRTHFYWLTLAIVVSALLLLRRAAMAPFGYALRALRDAPNRAEAIGLTSRRLLGSAFVGGGAFAGLAGALQAYHKGAVFPNALAIPVSVDALVMVLLGGLQTLSGPIVGAIVYHGLATEIARATEFWRLILGTAIIVLVVAFPRGIVGFARARFGSRR